MIGLEAEMYVLGRELSTEWRGKKDRERVGGFPWLCCSTFRLDYLSKPIIKLPALVWRFKNNSWMSRCLHLRAAVMAGCWQPHNMHTCCNWEVVLLVKWKNTSVITNCCCNWRDLLIRTAEVPGNLEIIWTLSRSPELYAAVGHAGHPA